MMLFDYSSIAINMLLKIDDLIEASDKCIRGVSWKESVQSYYMKRLLWIANTHRKLENGTYKPKRCVEFKIHERGKAREIRSYHISDRVVQKAFNEKILKPKIYPTLIYDNSASQKGKGTDFAIRRVKCFLQRHYRKYGNNGYALIMDFSNYFAQIDRNILMNKLARYLTNEESAMLKAIMSNEKEGLGLGSEINQTCAIFYASDIDHFIKEKLRIKGYERYMDDLVLIHHDRDYLKYCQAEITKLCERDKITVNAKKCKIINLKTDYIPYLKKQFRLTGTGKVMVRPIKKNLAHRKKRLKRMKELLEKDVLSIDNIVGSYKAWRGYVAKYDTPKRALATVDKLFVELFDAETLKIIKKGR